MFLHSLETSARRCYVLFSAFSLHIVFGCPPLPPISKGTSLLCLETRCCSEDAAASLEGRSAVSRGNHLQHMQTMLDLKANTFPLHSVLVWHGQMFRKQYPTRIAKYTFLQLLRRSKLLLNASTFFAWNSAPLCAHKSGTRSFGDNSRERCNTVQFTGTSCYENVWEVMWAASTKLANPSLL